MSMLIHQSSIKLSIMDNSIICDGIAPKGSISLNQVCGDLSRTTIRHVEEIKVNTAAYNAQKNKWALIATIIVVAAVCIPSAIVAYGVLALATIPAYKIYRLWGEHAKFMSFKSTDCAVDYARADAIIGETRRLLIETKEGNEGKSTLNDELTAELNVASQDLELIKKQLPKAAAAQALSWSEYTKGLVTYYMSSRSGNGYARI